MDNTYKINDTYPDSGISDKLLLSMGMMSAILFILVPLIDGATRNDYIIYYHTISHLSLGNRGKYAIVNSILVSLFILGFTFRLRYIKINNLTITRGIKLFFFAGFGLLLASIFVMDPVMDYPPLVPLDFTIRGRIHDISTLVTISALIINCFYWSKIYKLLKLTKWSLYSKISGILMIISFIIVLVFLMLELFYKNQGLPVGLVERIGFYIGFIWIFNFSLFFYKKRVNNDY